MCCVGVCEVNVPILPGLWWPAPSAGRLRRAASLSQAPSPSPSDSSRSRTGPESACPCLRSHTAHTDTREKVRGFISVRWRRAAENSRQLSGTRSPWRSVWGSGTGWGCWCRRTAPAGCSPPWRWSPHACRRRRRCRGSRRRTADCAPAGLKK